MSFSANTPFLIWTQMLVFWLIVFASGGLFVFPTMQLEMREIKCIQTACGCQEAHLYMQVKLTERKQVLRNETGIWSYCLLYSYSTYIKPLSLSHSLSRSLSLSLSCSQMQPFQKYKVSFSKLVEMLQIHLRDPFELILKHIIHCSPISSSGT